MLRKAVEKSSQSAVSRDLGFPLRSVQNYLNGISEPTQATLDKLAIYFELPIGWLRDEPFYSGLSEEEAREVFKVMVGDEPSTLIVKMVYAGIDGINGSQTLSTNREDFNYTDYELTRTIIEKTVTTTAENRKRIAAMIDGLRTQAEPE